MVFTNSPDASEMHLDYPGIRPIFINLQIIAYSPDATTDREGLLSISGVKASAAGPERNGTVLGCRF